MAWPRGAYPRHQSSFNEFGGDRRRRDDYYDQYDYEEPLPPGPRSRQSYPKGINNYRGLSSVPRGPRPRFPDSNLGGRGRGGSFSNGPRPRFSGTRPNNPKPGLLSTPPPRHPLPVPVTDSKDQPTSQNKSDDKEQTETDKATGDDALKVTEAKTMTADSSSDTSSIEKTQDASKKTPVKPPGLLPDPVMPQKSALKKSSLKSEDEGKPVGTGKPGLLPTPTFTDTIAKPTTEIIKAKAVEKSKESPPPLLPAPIKDVSKSTQSSPKPRTGILKNNKPAVIHPEAQKTESEDDFEDTSFCKYCKISFNSSEAFVKHTRGLMHTQKTMQVENQSNPGKESNDANESLKVDSSVRDISNKPKTDYSNPLNTQGFQDSGKARPDRYDNRDRYYGRKEEFYRRDEYHGHDENYGQDNENYGRDNENYGRDNENYGHYNENYGLGNDNYRRDWDHEQDYYGEDNRYIEGSYDRDFEKRGDYSEPSTKEKPPGQEKEFNAEELAKYGITKEMLAEACLLPNNTPVRERDLGPEDVGKKQFPNDFQCKLCDVKCTGPQSFQAHLSGAKHSFSVENYCSSGKSTVKKTQIKLVTSQRKSLTLELIKLVTEPIIGLEYITEFHKQDPKAIMTCVCNLCESKSDEHTVVSHLLGTKHRLNYMKEHHTEYFNHAKKFGGKKNQQTFIENLTQDIEKVDGKGVPVVKIIVEEEVEEKLEFKPVFRGRAILPTPSKRSINSAEADTGGKKGRYSNYKDETQDMYGQDERYDGTEETMEQYTGYQDHYDEYSDNPYLYGDDEQDTDMGQQIMETYPPTGRSYPQREKLSHSDSRLPSLLGNQPFNHDNQRSNRGNKPSLLGNQPPLLGNQPSLLGNQPSLLGNKPPLMGNQSSINSHQSSPSNHQAALSSHQPLLTSQQRSLSDHQSPLINQQSPLFSHQQPPHGSHQSSLPLVRQPSIEEQEGIKVQEEKLLEEKIEKEVQARLQQILSMKKPEDSGEFRKTKKPAAGMSSMSVLMQSLSDSLISNEDEAEMALQVSNALTQALLHYRMKTLSPEMLKQVIPNATELQLSDNQGNFPPRPGAPLSSRSHISGGSGDGSSLWNQDASVYDQSPLQNQPVSWNQQQNLQQWNQVTESSSLNKNGNQSKSDAFSQDSSNDWFSHNMSMDARIENFQNNLLKWNSGTQSEAVPAPPTTNTPLYSSNTNNYMSSYPANTIFYQGIPEEYANFLGNSNTSWPTNPPLPTHDAPKPPLPPS
ncbi:hypothetical protein SNE40_022987 [Patella caerulea]|uniref:C2H2-type domain-containing protein n=1 Tax=Patella caerulea TaxID=87958 RepID=A0AAN8GBK5_PATCE